MSTKIILLSGSRQVGKDTFFASLNRLYPNVYRRYAFADILKDDLNDLATKMFGCKVNNLSLVQKEIFRPMMIAYGCAWREIDVDHWVKQVDKKIEWDSAMLGGMNTYVSSDIPVISDCRFANEYHYFAQKYGKDNCKLIYICRIGAPEATDEEKKTLPELARLANDTVFWNSSSDNNYIDNFVKRVLASDVANKKVNN